LWHGAAARQGYCVGPGLAKEKGGGSRVGPAVEIGAVAEEEGRAPCRVEEGTGGVGALYPNAQQTGAQNRAWSDAASVAAASESGAGAPSEAGFSILDEVRVKDGDTFVADDRFFPLHVDTHGHFCH